MKKINRNMFKPFMFICLGLLAVMLMSAVAYDPPGEPGKPEIVDWAKDRCTIKFTPPKNDGGSPISGYRIGYKYKGGLWETAIKLVLAYQVTISGLIEGEVIEFRVSAVNKAGEGPPSESSKPHVIRDR